MAYEAKTNWQLDDTVTEQDMNRIEQGIENVQQTIASATSTSTASTLIKRDTNGRAQVAAPAAANDIARKQETDAALNMAQEAEKKAQNAQSTAQSAQTKADAALRAIDGIIGGGQNFNDYRQTGFYRVENAASAANFPPNAYPYGTLIVTKNGASGQQIFLSHGSSQMQIRSFWADGSWQPWAKVWTNENDGPGSGLDADVLDGMQPTDQAHGNTVMQRRADGATDVTTIVANNWFRSTGHSGWYSQDFGGGWHMTDPTWIRAYNGKNVYTSGHLSADGEIYLRGTALAATRLNNGMLEFWNGSGWQPVGGVKKVQRGFTTVSTSTVDLGITPVNLSKSFVSANLSYVTFHGNTFGTHETSARLINESTVRIEVINRESTPTRSIAWEVIEYY
ncbi:shufflon system plasmid conjugative transfer pilus tip adhesin PilV [Paenibacillus elgii]|uniref:shufflon system plasmid conjugative transfer pilus tip adhesin PilV n=1 Tax=Paenibacillus elgii TaxID=189691 RepID=UPI000FD943F9|nr:shufflon system plasmid conjugative transfer pilus tip adhesin PilV [Paenibacillus elgii]NEN84354.1 shufflon system plasmid conjugative transfer pilus tip adhesin PilV [Paenibacillus elgii]